MHYRNGREAKNGDKIVKLEGGKVVAFGVLHSAVPGNDFCNGNIATTTMFKTRLPGNVPVNGVFELGMPKRGLEVLVRHWEQTGKPVVYKGALEVNAAPCTGELCINFHENSESATLSYTVLDSAEAAA